MKNIQLFILTASLFLFSNCGKENINSTDILVSKTWKRGLIDKNPSSNPTGKILYYAVLNCEKDDVFKFNSDGKLTINRSIEKCDINENQSETQTYTLDRTTKKLVINGIEYTLAEESKEQIKYFSPVPSTTGSDNLIFLLQ